MKKIISTQYQCELCRTKYDEEKYCIECEKSCKFERLKLKDINLRFKEIFNNCYTYEAKNSDDLEKCLRSKFFYSYTDDFNYEDYKYPCKVMIFEYMVPDTYDDCWDSCLHIEKVDEFIKKIKGGIL